MFISNIIYSRIKTLSLYLKALSSYIIKLTIFIANYYTSSFLLQKSAIINKYSINANSY